MNAIKRVSPLVWLGLFSTTLSILMVVFFGHDRPAKITLQNEPLPDITTPAVVMEELVGKTQHVTLRVRPQISFGKAPTNDVVHAN